MKKMTYGDLGAKFKLKYKGSYTDLSDYELGKLVVHKYPVYKKNIISESMRDLIHKQTAEDKAIRLGERKPLTDNEWFDRKLNEYRIKSNSMNIDEKKVNMDNLRKISNNIQQFRQKEVDDASNTWNRGFPRTFKKSNEINTDQGAISNGLDYVGASLGDLFSAPGRAMMLNLKGQPMSQLEGRGFVGDMVTDPTMLPMSALGGPILGGSKLLATKLGYGGSRALIGGLSGAAEGALGSSGYNWMNGLDQNIGDIVMGAGTGSVLPSIGRGLKKGAYKAGNKFNRISGGLTGADPIAMKRAVKESLGEGMGPTITSEAGNEHVIADDLVNNINSFNNVTSPIDEYLMSTGKNIETNTRSLNNTRSYIKQELKKLDGLKYKTPVESSLYRKLTNIQNVIDEGLTKGKNVSDLITLRRRVDKMTKFQTANSNELNGKLKQIRTKINQDIEGHQLSRNTLDDVNKSTIREIKPNIKPDLQLAYDNGRDKLFTTYNNTISELKDKQLTNFKNRLAQQEKANIGIDLSEDNAIHNNTARNINNLKSMINTLENNHSINGKIRMMLDNGDIEGAGKAMQEMYNLAGGTPGNEPYQVMLSDMKHARNASTENTLQNIPISQDNTVMSKASRAATELREAANIQDPIKRSNEFTRIAKQYNIDLPITPVMQDYKYVMGALDDAKRRVGTRSGTELSNAERVVQQAGNPISTNNSKKVLEQMDNSILLGNAYGGNSLSPLTNLNASMQDRANAAGMARQLGITELSPKPSWRSLAGKQQSNTPMTLAVLGGLSGFGLQGMGLGMLASGGALGLGSPRLAYNTLQLGKTMADANMTDLIPTATRNLVRNSYLYGTDPLLGSINQRSSY